MQNQSSLDLEQRLDCLRALPFERLVEASVRARYLYKRVLTQTDDFLFPARTTEQLLASWRPLPLLVSVTELEMPLAAFTDARLFEACAVFCRMLGYAREATAAECARHYANGSESLARDAFQAVAQKLARRNAQAGGASFLSVFTQPGANFHAADLMYLLGLHRDSLMAEHSAETAAEDQLMNDFYPALFRRFVLGLHPLEGESAPSHGVRCCSSCGFPNLQCPGSTSFQPHPCHPSVGSPQPHLQWMFAWRIANAAVVCPPGRGFDPRGCCEEKQRANSLLTVGADE